MNPENLDTRHLYCFVGHSNEAPWRADILSACADVLPKFGLEPWYAADHYEPTKTLRDKVVEAIANARYGIYDLSSWQDERGVWHLPRNVLIELGIAIAYNRPTLLLRHTSNGVLPLSVCLQGIEIIEFAGETTLKRELEKRLPQWIDAPPESDWLDRFCIFGNRVCPFREQHPCNRSWRETEKVGCHIADGLDRWNPAHKKVESDEIRGVFDEVLTRYVDLSVLYLEEAPLKDGFRFRLCGYCQSVRSTPIGIYRITPTTPADVFVTIGIGLALDAFFEYESPRVLLVNNETNMPSLLRGYEAIEERAASEVKARLRRVMPTLIHRMRATAWKPRPLPFVDPVLIESSQHTVEAMQDAGLPGMQVHKTIKDLKSEEILSGTVAQIYDFGASVLLDGLGVRGLIHISELAWFPVSNPHEVLEVGQKVQVRVLRVDAAKGRIGLSLKRVQPDPWSHAQENYRPGELVESVVTRVTEFGAFVRLRSGIEGLLHVSEMADIRPDHPQSLVSPGDLLLLRVLRLEPERRRIGLSLRQVSEAEWAEWARAYREKHAPTKGNAQRQGTSSKQTVEKDSAPTSTKGNVAGETVELPGAVLLAFRERYGLSRSEFSARIGTWSADQVRNLETGRSRFALGHLDDLLTAGLVRPDDLWYRRFIAALSS